VQDADPRVNGQVVVDGHLLAADRGDPPHLAGVEPAHVNVRGQAAVVEEVVVEQAEVGDILEAAVRVPGGPRLGGDRLAAQHVIDNGNVMRGEVEDDVDVVLVQAQVEAGAVDVVHLAQFPVLYQLADLPDGGVVLDRVTD